MSYSFLRVSNILDINSMSNVSKIFFHSVYCLFTQLSGSSAVKLILTEI